MKRLALKHWLVFFWLAVLSNSLAQAQLAGPGSALSLDGATGYVQVTNGVWFNGNFTVEGWVLVRSYNSWSRLFDFGNAGYLQEVYLALSDSTTGFPKMGVFTNGNFNLVGSSQQLPLNQWTHLAATLNGTTATIFLNGKPVGSGTVLVPNNVVRTNNYIGRSNFAGDGYANAIFDEVRIWSVARSEGQIQANMR
ncbi:MAG TPA: LamG domain-containing protein [Tepidisphaeraceae bacterium]|nr:LamG domain-containing protein [Tepidisphaeraceae bacterium]